MLIISYLKKKIFEKTAYERGKVALDGVCSPEVAPVIRGDGFMYCGRWYLNVNMQ